MPPTRTLLVALDFSESSRKALEFAVGLARATGARLELFHAYHLPIGTGYDVSLPGELLPRVRDAAAARLDEAVAKVRAEGVEATGHLAEGVASEAICDAAERLRADLVVMGTRGLSGLAHVLLGSVAEHTLKTAPCPVITVPLGDQ